MTTKTAKVKYYGEDKETDAAIERLIERDVLACQSSLIDELLKRGDIEGLTYEDIENLYPDTEAMDEDECKEYCEDHGILCDDLDSIDEWRDTIQEYAEPQEIYEWWLVSPWLARALRAQNEPILELSESYGAIWWGRTCTGQAIALDPTFYDIHARFSQA